MFVPTSAPNAACSWDFIKFLTEQEQQLSIPTIAGWLPVAEGPRPDGVPRRQPRLRGLPQEARLGMKVSLTPPLPEFDELETKLATHLVDAYADFANLAGKPDKIQALLDTWAAETNDILTRVATTAGSRVSRGAAASPRRVLALRSPPVPGDPTVDRNPLAAVRAVPRRTWLRYRFVFLVLAPVMALFIYLRVIPTGQAVVMSLFEWELIKPAEQFVGLDNYANLLKDENFRLAFFNTTVFAVATTIISVALALLLATLLSR